MNCGRRTADSHRDVIYNVVAVVANQSWSAWSPKKTFHGMCNTKTAGTQAGRAESVITLMMMGTIPVGAGLSGKWFGRFVLKSVRTGKGIRPGSAYTLQRTHHRQPSASWFVIGSQHSGAQWWSNLEDHLYLSSYWAGTADSTVHCLLPMMGALFKRDDASLRRM